MKLRFKILLMCLGCTLFALILQTLLFQRTSSGVIYNRAKEERVHALQNMQNEIYSYIKNMESNLIEVYTEDALIQSLKEGASASELRTVFYRSAYEIATTKFETGDSVVALYLYTPEHEIISTYRRAVTPKHNYPLDIYDTQEDCNAEIVKEYINSEQSEMLISGYYNKYREKDIVRFVLKLCRNRNYKELLGYLVCDVDSKVVTSIMEKYSIDPTMFIWLQPQGDRAVAAIGTQEEEKENYLEISRKIKEENENSIQEMLDGNQEFFEVEQNKYNLTAYSLMPQELLTENQKALTMNLIVIAMLMVGAAAFLTVLVSRSLTRPLDKLMGTIERIKQGETGLRAEIHRKDEIGQLGKNFNEMLDGMEALTQKEKRASFLLSQAEYKALQAQINPHFLYNTLDTMSSIAQIRNCLEVSRLSQALSNIFRYSLNMKEPLSTLSKEIVHLKNYSYVMGVRMQDNVQYIYDIEEALLQAKIPRLSLQPIVENSLNHGLRNKRGEKCIWIQAKAEKEKLLITVADNGVGMDAGALNESLKKNDIHYVEQGSSIGLHNINARLKMLYGEAYGLWVESTLGKGTRVCMEIPKKEGEANGEIL